MAKHKKHKKNKLPAYNRRTLTNSILKIFRDNPGNIYNYKQIAKKLRITDSQIKSLIIEVLNQLTSSEKIEEIYRGKFKFRMSSSFITGTVQMTQSGSAYIISDESEDDIFISRNNLGGALNRDEVKVVVYARRKKRKPEGEVIEITKRIKTDFVGIVMIMKKHAFLDVTERFMPYDIFIPLENLNGAEDGQKAIARIVEWKSHSKNPTGKIVDVLGDVGNNDTEMHAILTEFNLPYKYPERLDKIAKEITPGITPEEVAKREDFRNVLTFTIDPADAKDFDDALSYKELKNGNVEVGIHIADVTHYVKPGTAIDGEGYKRATSVYLVDRTVPMLPEHLSNFICSLRPNEDKLTYSAIFELDENATIKNKRFGRTVINSDKRFDYNEAQNIIETGEGAFANELIHINKLAKKLREKRFKNGAISFDRVETKFKLDDDGKPLGVYFKVAKDSNKLIEEFMLLANRKVAELFGKTKSKRHERPFVYRIHDEPDLEKLYTFSNFIKRFGYNFTFTSENDVSYSLNKLLEEVKGSKEQNTIEQLAVRSMAKAVYSADNIGHYGLSFSHYTHFTSPIRRYPDMMVHRLLTRYLDGDKPASKEKLESKCKHSSDMEQLAVNAERASIKYKEVEFLQDKLGSFFDGVITGVTERGLYVEIAENKIEGMITIREMDDDFYVFDDKNYCIIGQRKHKRYQIGDDIKIQLIRANLQKRQIDFGLAENAE